jgi:hypothetical protein
MAVLLGVASESVQALGERVVCANRGRRPGTEQAESVCSVHRAGGWLQGVSENNKMEVGSRG